MTLKEPKKQVVKLSMSDPRRFFGVTKQPKPIIDKYLEDMREGWL